MSDAKAEAREAARDAVRFQMQAMPRCSSDEEADQIADAAIDAYEAALAKTHVLVPREATEAMVIAVGKVTIHGGGDIYGNGWVTPSAAPDVYRAMIAAAEPK